MNDDLHGDEVDDIMQGDSGSDRLASGPGINILRCVHLQSRSGNYDHRLCLLI
jgi:hypothetical protein